MPFFPDVGGRQCVVFHGFIHRKAGWNREQQVLFTEEVLVIDGTVHTSVIDQKIQGTGKQPFSQFRGGGLHQIQVHLGILFVKAGNQRRQDIRGKEVRAANGEGAAFNSRISLM